MNLLESTSYFQDSAGQLRPIRWHSCCDLREYVPDLYETGLKLLLRNESEASVELLLLSAMNGLEPARRDLAILFSQGYKIGSSAIPDYNGVWWWLRDSELFGIETQMLSNFDEMYRTHKVYSKEVCFDYRCADTIGLLAHSYYLPAISLAAEFFFFGFGRVHDRARGLAWAKMAVYLDCEESRARLETMCVAVDADVKRAANSLFKSFLKDYRTNNWDTRRLSIYGH